MDMKIQELKQFGIKQEILDVWEQTEGAALLPVQEQAVDAGLFKGKNLLISAPTSSGKTFIGEMAQVKEAQNGKSVLYLVPLKALAEEKYHVFNEKYKQFGIQTVISTREHDEFDQRISSGSFQIAVMVFEKLQPFLIHNPDMLKNIKLIVVDELQVLADAMRGPGLELLLTKIITTPKPPQIVGLSATLGNPGHIAQWLNCKLITSTTRPVELHQGVLFQGKFYYKKYNTGETGEEDLIPNKTANHDAALFAIVTHLAHNGEQILVFLKTRNETRQFAQKLARSLSLQPAERAMDELQLLEETQSRALLLSCLQSGVAFHNADLTSDERYIVEKYARENEIRVICSTPTLATGVNLPAQTTIITPKRWERNPAFGKFTLQWIPRMEEENMAGRAGRLKLSDQYGKAILIAENAWDKDVLWNKYITSSFEDVEPQLKDTPLESHILSLVSSGLCKTEKELHTFLSRTFTGLLYWTKETEENFEKKFSEALSLSLKYALITKTPEGCFEPTEIGKAVSFSGVCVRTAVEFLNFLHSAHNREVPDIELLHLAAHTEEGKKIYIPMSYQMDESDRYEYMFRESAAGYHVLGGPITRVLNSQYRLMNDNLKSVKISLMLEDYVKDMPTNTLEEKHSILSGMLKRVGEELSWIVDAIATIAKPLRMDKELVTNILTLSERLKFGVSKSGLPLSKLRVRGLSRELIRRLVYQGYDDPASLKDIPLSEFSRIIPERIAKRLHKKITQKEEEKEVEQKQKEKKPLDISTPPSHPDSPLFNDTFHLVGKPKKRRLEIRINTHAAYVTETSFDLLLKFALALKKNKEGWLHKDALDIPDERGQCLSKLRRQIKPCTKNKSGRIIENNYFGFYRLCIPPENISLDADTIKSLPNASWQDIVTEWEKVQNTKTENAEKETVLA